MSYLLFYLQFGIVVIFSILKTNFGRIGTIILEKLVSFFPKQFQTGIRNSIIIKNSLIPFNLIKDGFDSRSRPMRAVGSHGFHDIENGQNTCFYENFVLFQILWIAGISVSGYHLILLNKTLPNKNIITAKKVITPKSI